MSSQPKISISKQEPSTNSFNLLTASSLGQTTKLSGLDKPKLHHSHHHHHHHHSSKAHKLKKLEAKRAKAEAKKSRVEHVVIEKRYRMKITDSLNELKNMLPGSDDKKVWK